MLLCFHIPHHIQDAVQLLLTAVEAVRLLVIHTYAEQPTHCVQQTMSGCNVEDLAAVISPSIRLPPQTH